VRACRIWGPVGGARTLRAMRVAPLGIRKSPSILSLEVPPYPLSGGATCVFGGGSIYYQ